MISLRIPQARVLATLMPDNLTDQVSEYPTLTRIVLCDKIGVSRLSDSIWRALVGLKETSKSTGTSYPGLIHLGLVEIIALDIEGVIENNYRITNNGVKALADYITTNGPIPPVKATAMKCSNKRYKIGSR